MDDFTSQPLDMLPADIHGDALKPTSRQTDGRQIALRWGVGASAATLLLLPLIYGRPLPADMFLAVHSLLEVLAVTASLMVFAVLWSARQYRPHGSEMLLGATFLAAGLLDIGHLLSYAGMPELLTPNSPTKAIHFWLYGRTLTAAGLLLAALRAGRGQPAPAQMLPLLALLLVLCGFTLALLGERWLPVWFDADGGLSPYKIAVEYVLALAFATATALFAWRAYRNGAQHLAWLACGAWLQVLCTICVTLYQQPHDASNLLGHILKVLGCACIYRALVVRSIDEPYRRLAAERARLLESEARFRDNADAAPVAIWLADAQGARQWFNRTWLQFRGRTLAEETGDGWRSGVHPEDIARCSACLHESLTEGRPYRIEYRIRHRDGGWRWVLENGAPRSDEAGCCSGLIGSVVDIDQQKRTALELRLAASVFEHAREGVVITNAEGIILDANETYCAQTGYAREELLQQTPSLMRSGLHDETFYTALAAALARDGFWQGELWSRRKNGRRYAQLLAISAVRGDDGEISHYVGLSTDITELKNHQARLEHLARHDPLTQLANRTLFAERLQQGIGALQAGDGLLAVCYLDLDGFKPVNDRFGHAAGDRLLVEVACRLQESVGEHDTVARFGGDEFALLIGPHPNFATCEAVLKRILEHVAQVYTINVGDRVTMSASIGVTLFPDDDADADTLLRHADRAMYQAKQSGRNRYVLFDPESDRRKRSRQDLLGSVAGGLRRGEFCLYYQPKVDLTRGCVAGAEALIRWQHPERGLLLPGAFLPAIEGSELQLELGDWVMEQALHQIADWQRCGVTLSVSVNIHATHLLHPDFVERLANLIGRHGANRTPALEIEVLETAALHDLDQVARILEGCRAFGVEFALDDFGTGFSSLLYLRHLPVRTLKIDRSFVCDMLDDPEALAIVEGVIGLARAFRREVIAEGVESAAHGQRLLALGCHLVQGFGVARPMPAADLLDWIGSHYPHTQTDRARRCAGAH
ncbi:PAS domain S-box-containing protein/diguanylate cyclase (GGDEF)-like protein [Plasticicumulans acidivorans]|uniref:PAS domain S-box-containing protein/diguanylate cyclase (GGDEF)-like protein n=1 Tax=Plasticicumulans acidivorans TaxID=886464 RepID=A0A317N1E2_9GAMM|nr:PAS domain S-box-containing protein/diguanylate cyclase (GGDEF)-like protein [Plasticicumulans acidivorans]